MSVARYADALEQANVPACASTGCMSTADTLVHFWTVNRCFSLLVLLEVLLRCAIASANSTDTVPYNHSSHACTDCAASLANQHATRLNNCSN
jgi:hypothetical protein